GQGRVQRVSRRPGSPGTLLRRQARIFRGAQAGDQGRSLPQCQLSAISGTRAACSRGADGLTPAVTPLRLLPKFVPLRGKGRRNFKSVALTRSARQPISNDGLGRRRGQAATERI